MSNATHGGKGDRDRTDRSKFENNWDKIFGRKEEEKQKITQILDEIGTGPHEFSPPLTEVQIDRKIREWNMMYDCLQNIHLYEYPLEEVKELLKQIKIS